MLTTIVASLSAVDVPPEEVVLRAQDLYYNMRFDDARRALNEIEAGCSSICRVKVAHLRGLLAKEEKDKRMAESWFREMEEICTESPDLQDTADGYAWIAQARSRLMLVKGIGYVIRSAPTLERFARRALDIEPNHVTALLVLAQGKLNAPRIFGGDVGLAISLLMRALETRELERGERFLAHLNLGEAYRKDKSREEAVHHASRALELYPHNEDALALMRELE